MLKQTEYEGVNFVFEKKMSTMFVKSTDANMELIFNSETRGMLIKSAFNFTQENSSGIMMSTHVDDCVRNKLDQ